MYNEEEQKKKWIEYSKKYYKEHKEQIRETKRKYCQIPKNREKKREWDKQYQKKARIKFKDKIKKYRKEYREKYPEKCKAMKIVFRNIHNGKLKKRSCCEVCGSFANIQGHHSDYDKPLKVIWLCPKCHKKLHINLKEKICKKEKITMGYST